MLRRLAISLCALTGCYAGTAGVAEEPSSTDTGGTAADPSAASADESEALRQPRDIFWMSSSGEGRKVSNEELEFP